MVKREYYIIVYSKLFYVSLQERAISTNFYGSLAFVFFVIMLSHLATNLMSQFKVT